MKGIALFMSYFQTACTNRPNIEDYVKNGVGLLTFSVPSSGKEMKYIINSVYNEV
jgi:hypothetical protein